MNTQLPVRVVSDHLQLSPQHGGRLWPPECRACGQPWPCHTFQRNLQGQCGSREDRMRAHMLIHYLRLVSRPELQFLGPEVHAAMLGWIDGAVQAQQKLEQARDALRTGARVAVQRMTTYAQRRWAMLTDPRGVRPPVRGVAPRYGEVRDGDGAEVLAGDRG